MGRKPTQKDKEQAQKLGERIEKLRNYLGISKKEMAQVMNIFPTNYDRYRKKGVVIGADKIANILRCYPEVNPHWLLLGKGPMFLEDEKKSSYCPVKLYRGKCSSADREKCFAEVLSEPLLVSEQFARVYFDVSPERLILFPVIGNSMEPTIPDGAVAVVKKYEAENCLIEGAVYALVYENKLLVKRIQRRKTQNAEEWKLISDNPAYDPIVFRVNEKTRVYFKLIGRVLGYVFSFQKGFS